MSSLLAFLTFRPGGTTRWHADTGKIRSSIKSQFPLVSQCRGKYAALTVSMTVRSATFYRHAVIANQGMPRWRHLVTSRRHCEPQAKQSMSAAIRASPRHGLPRRCAPRNDNQDGLISRQPGIGYVVDRKADREPMQPVALRHMPKRLRAHPGARHRSAYVSIAFSQPCSK